MRRSTKESRNAELSAGPAPPTSSSSSSVSTASPLTTSPHDAQHVEGGVEGSGRPSTATPSRRQGSPKRLHPTHGSLHDITPRGDSTESPEKRFAYMQCPVLSPHHRHRQRASASSVDGSPTHTPRRTRTPSPSSPGAVRQGKTMASTLSPVRGRTTEEAMSNYVGSTPPQQRQGRRSTSAHERRAPPAAVVPIVDPGEFSLETYRELHQRQFKSPHEELFFLRRDFVCSRKTLAVLHEETVRLKAELQARVDENANLQERLEWYRRQLDRLRGSAATFQNACCDRMLYMDRIASGPDSQQPADDRDTAAMGDGNDDGEKERGVTSGGNEGTAGVSPRVPHEVHLTSSPLSLYAAAGAASAKHRRNAKGKSDGVDNEINTVELIDELRRNLAKRDTAIDQAKMEVAEANRARAALERECRQAKQEASQALQEQQRTLSVLNDKLSALDALEEALKALRADVAAKEEELTRLRTKDERMRLLAEFPSAQGVDAGLTQHEYLFDQVKTYRERWQAAEDRVDELSRQVLSLSAATQLTPVAAVTRPSDAETLRRDDEVREQQETIRRLQRKLERESESASFREEQARQQRQEELRQHAMEVAALREQLQAARNELLNEAKDREALTRQLRQATHTETMADTLQSQNHSLKQRTAEVTAELAQVQGRQKELEVSLQREMGERLRLTQEVDRLSADRQALERKSSILQEAVDELRGKLGAAEARCFTLEQLLAHAGSAAPQEEAGRTAAPSTSPVMPVRSPLQGDGPAMASELKGYAALMSLNADLQERLHRIERQQERPRQSSARASTEASDAASAEGNNSGVVSEPPRTHLAAEVSELREELRRTRKAQVALLEQWNALQREHAEVLSDNLLLANGTELLHRELKAVLSSKQRGGVASSARDSEEPSRRGPRLTRTSSSRLRGKLQEVKQYACGDTTECAPIHVEGSQTTPSLVRESLAYAQELSEALSAAKRQVASLSKSSTPIPSRRRCFEDAVSGDGLVVTIAQESGPC